MRLKQYFPEREPVPMIFPSTAVLRTWGCCIPIALSPLLMCWLASPLPRTSALEIRLRRSLLQFNEGAYTSLSFRNPWSVNHWKLGTCATTIQLAVLLFLRHWWCFLHERGQWSEGLHMSSSVALLITIVHSIVPGYLPFAIIQWVPVTPYICGGH